MTRDSSGPMYVPFRRNPCDGLAAALGGALYLALVTIFLFLASHLLTS